MPAPRKNSDRYRSMAHYFGALIRDLRDTYELRVGDPLTVAELAARAGYSASMIGQLERGESLPESGQRVQALDDALRADGQLKTVWPLVQRLGHCSIDDLAATTIRIIAGYRENGSGSLPEGDDMERRHLFQLAGLGLLAQGPLFGAGEPVRHMLERVLNTAESYTAADWELACFEHMHAIQTLPPSTVRDDLVLDMAAVQQTLTRSRADQVGDLQRVAAWLAVLHSNVLTRLGEHGAARRWWRTARQAADASGDKDMQAWVRGYEAVFGLYSPRRTEVILALARNAQSLNGVRVTPGLMKAVGAEAQALAVMGRQQEAVDRLHHLHELAEHYSVREDYGWTEDSTWFTSSWVHSYGGATEMAREARDRVRSCSPGYQNAANIRLHEAISVGSSGGYNEALQLAAQVMSDLEPAYRTHMIAHTAHRVLDTIPLDKRRELPALGDYREAISAPVAT
ncbi:hypothetical protein Ssi03_36400 [Sphaerisporangium siamense]|uniref:Transcriptional regulator with XRE-family HTH domain n=1 Tax=Sphaerisporangium siamense TaxID=795645 RepID=A0A7W7D8U4_9ACTN|nr:helix-turn-helix transcriptional regulator [Sphaerisporangium siamense]MBB4701525.1 transcriptional regulator with XRE-family HTH domain [Sphaerisporangium siamense]GII85650.1 hypothetical protein Ssi03_36400 [Sphaerisporangium siamense]